MVIIFSKLLFAKLYVLTAFYGLRVTYDKTVTRPNVTGFNWFWSVAVRLWAYYHIRQPVAVSVTQNWAEKPDLTGLLNTKCILFYFFYFFLANCQPFFCHNLVTLSSLIHFQFSFVHSRGLCHRYAWIWYRMHNP